MDRDPRDPLKQNREILALARRLSVEYEQAAEKLTETLQRIREETHDE
jgi:predicted transcriptional regulator